MNDNDDDYRTGQQLLAEWNCETREAKLERAVIALLATVEELHEEYKNQSLKDNLTDPEVYCSCADAYRMGMEALKT